MINEERALLGLPEANRADLRFSVNTPGEVFVLNKQDGVLRQLVAIPEPSGVALGLAAWGVFALAAGRLTASRPRDEGGVRNQYTRRAISG